MKKVQAKDHENYTTFSIIAFLIPLVGFIMGIVYLTKEKQVDRKLGEHLLVVMIISIVAWSLFWTLLAGGNS